MNKFIEYVEHDVFKGVNYADIVPDILYQLKIYVLINNKLFQSETIFYCQSTFM